MYVIPISQFIPPLPFPPMVSICLFFTSVSLYCLANKIIDTIFHTARTVHGVLKARILKWFAIPFSSGPHSVRPLHYDLAIWVAPHGMA